MSWNEGRLQAHWPKLLGDRVDQLLLISMREVPATDRSAKEDVSDQREFGVRMVKDNMAGRVTGTMTDIEPKSADTDLVIVVEPSRGFERFAENAIFCAIGSETIDPIAVGLVRPLDWNSKFAGKDAGASAMVDVPVGEQDLLDCHSGLLSSGLETGQIAAWVDERAAHCLGAPQQRAILLKRRNRDDGRAERRLAH